MLFKKKALGIELCTGGAKLVLLGRGEKTLRLAACCVTPFPPGTIKFSLREENIQAPHAFVAAIREGHLRLLTTNKRIAVSLPDSAGRVMLMDVETRFKNRDEGADVIRWKLKKNFPLDVNDIHLDYQILQEKDSGALSVLVAVISKQVINQYEDLFVEAGLEPDIIDFTTFNLYKLFLHRLEMAENAAFVTFYGGVLTMLVFYSGILTFYRSKELSDGLQGGNRVYSEINSSLLVYQNKYANQAIDKVFCMAVDEDVEAFRSVVAEATGIEPVLFDVERVVTCEDSLIIDKKTLHSLTAALGAAARSL
jgi:type IV pilus assembly protein PilM